MTDTLERPADAGTWRQVDGGWELRFERRLRHAPERVWAALTTPAGLACWLAEARIDPRPGGRMDLRFTQPERDDFPCTAEVREQSNEVLVHEPCTRFEHTFGGDPEAVVRWRLEPDGDGTRLVLTHFVPEAWSSHLARVLSGWHHHLEGLDDAARGVRHPWDWDRWTALRDAYAREIAR